MDEAAPKPVRVRHLMLAILLVLLSIYLWDRFGPSGSRRYVQARVFFESLHAACAAYRLDFGDYPPLEPDGDSRALHRYLGSPGPSPGAPAFQFRANQLDWKGPGPPDPMRPARVLDPWGRPIRYVRGSQGPGFWSAGPSGRFGDEDDLRR